MRTFTMRPVRQEPRSERGYTLTEVMITIAILGVVMLPLLAWMLIVLDRTEDTRSQDETADFAMIGRTFIRDVQGSTVAVRNAGTLCGSPGGGAPAPVVDAENPVADSAVALHLESLEVLSPAEGTTQDVTVQYVVRTEVQEDAGTTGALWRRRCVTTDSGEQTYDDTKLAAFLSTPGLDDGAIDGLLPLQERFAQFDCDSVVDGDTDALNDCEVITLQIQPRDRKLVKLSATRRADKEDAASDDARPRPVIECSPSCIGYRNDAKAYSVVLDSTKSRNVTNRLWSFGDGSTSDLPSPSHDFTCTDSTPQWVPAAKECRFTVSLTVIGGDPLRAARATTTVIVKNSVPVIVLDAPNPPTVSGYRRAPVVFDATRSSDLDDGDLHFRWDFGDGTVASGQKAGYAAVSKTYNSAIAPGAFVTLTVTDDDGATDVETIPLTISNHPPIANFQSDKPIITLCPTGTPPAECDNRQVVFDATWVPPASQGQQHKGSYDPDGAPNGTATVRTGPGPVASWEWSITRRNADGTATPINYINGCTQPPTPPGGPTPPPVCTTPGFTNSVLPGGGPTQPILKIQFPNQIAVYDITLRVTDNNGLVASSRTRLTANAQPRAVIDITRPADGSTVIPRQDDNETFAFTGVRSFDPDYDSVAAAGQPQIASYAWTVTRLSGRDTCVLPTGNQETFVPDLCPGRYVVRLVVEDQFGALSPRVDGRVLPIAARTEVTIKVNERPSVTNQSLSGGAVQRNVPFTFTPVAKDSYTEGGVEKFIAAGDQIVNYLWYERVGNGAWTALGSETGPTLTRTYGTLGSYSVRLRVTDNDGAVTEGAPLTFSVVPATPVARFDVTPGEIGPLGEPFRFTNASYDPDGTVTSCQWTVERPGGPVTFGPSAVACDLADQTWSDPGQYLVSLTVWDNDSPPLQSVVFSRTITVLKPIKVTVTMSDGTLTHNAVDGPWLVKDPTQVWFTATITDENPGASITGRTWRFGNGRPDVSNTNGPPAVEYKRVGSQLTFNGSFTVSNDLGLVTTVPFTISVNVAPVAVVGEVRPVTVPSPPYLLNVNCPPAAGLADSALANSYSVAGCKLVENITTPGFEWAAGQRLNARGSYDPDGAPDFGEILLRNLSPVGNSRICWFELTAAFQRACHSPTAQLNGDSIVLGGASQTPRTGRTHEMRLRVTDAIGAPPSELVSFVLYLNMRPYGVRIDGPNGTTPTDPAPTLQLKPYVETNATNLSTPARDGDAEVPLRYHWRFTEAGSTTVLSVCGPSFNQPCEEVVTDGRTYPKLTFPPGTSGKVRLTVTDERKFAVEATPRDFVVPTGKPVARIVATSADATRFLPELQRLVRDTPSNAFSSQMTASFSGATSTDSAGGTALTYEWQITRESVTGTPTGPVTATGVSLPNQTFSNSLPTSPSSNAGKVTGTWRVTLTVREGTESDSTSVLVRLNVPPTTGAVCGALKYEEKAPFSFLFTNGVNDGSDSPPSTTSLMKMSWNWGDGTQLLNVPVATASHTYTDFTTNVANGDAPDRRLSTAFTVTDEDGASTTTSCGGAIRLNRAPTVTESVDRPVLKQTNFNGAVTFTASATDADFVNSEVPASAFSWVFRSTGPVPQAPNTFPSCSATMGDPVPGAAAVNGSRTASFTVPNSTPGVYWGVVRVTDPGGNGNPVTKCVKVRVNAKPVAHINQNVPGIDGYVDLNFGSWQPRSISGSHSTDDDKIVLYKWRFEDECGREIAPPNAPLASAVDTPDAMTTVMVSKHVPGSCVPYDQGARGKIKLTVVDSDGEEGETDHPLSSYNGQPTAQIKALTTNWVANDEHLTVDGTESTDSGGPIQKWRWTVTKTSNGEVVHTSTDQTTGLYQLPLLPWGQYQVSLVVVDSDGLDSTMNVNLNPPEPVPPPVRSFTVRQRPTAVIRTDPTNTEFAGDLLQRVNFFGGDSLDEDASPPHSGLTYHWDIFDGNGVLETTWDERDFPDVDFIGSGTHRVRLTVKDTHGLEHFTERMVVLNARPQVTVTASPTVANPPPSGRVSFTFDPTGTQDTDGTITSCRWRFILVDQPDENDDVLDTGAPDGGTQTITTNCNTTPVTHQFPSTPGTYTVEMRATDNRGATATRSITVRVNERPTAALPSGTLALERNVVGTLDGSLSSDSDSASGQWPTGIKNYFWELIRNGETTPFYTQNASSSTTSIQLPANTPAPQSGLVRLTVTDANDRVSASVTRPYTLTGATPVASITVDPSDLVLTPGEVRTFGHANSTDPDSPTLTNFRWRFYFNGSSTPYRTVDLTDRNATVAEIFALPGRYEVRLTVTDGDGMTDSETVAIKANTAPTAGIDISGAPFTAQVGVPRSFAGGPPHSTDSDADDPQDPIASYLWTFRDGNGQLYDSAEGPNPSMTFDQAGTYTVQLIVFDHDGAASAPTSNYTIQVTE